MEFAVPHIVIYRNMGLTNSCIYILLVKTILHSNIIEFGALYCIMYTELRNT
jgi:hypothetical protein